MKKKLTMEKRRNLTGWAFLTPATILILWMSFYPMFRALILSMQSGAGSNMKFAGLANYQRMVNDKVFWRTTGNTFIYLLLQVPVMLLFAMILASMLNTRNLKFKGLFRTAIFLPCATSLVSYSMIFRSMFAMDGLVNSALVRMGILDTGYNWLANTGTARMVIVLALLWRWTGYNMVFFLSALQNIDYSIYEAAKIDGANVFQQFTRITAPLVRPTILLTAIMSTNGTLQLYDESVNLTNGGPANTSMTMSHYIYDVAFTKSQMGYAAALSFIILILVAVLALVQMKVGDKR